MSKKKFKKGDLVEFDFGYGLVIQAQTEPDQQDEGRTTEFCKVMWSNGVIDWIAMWRLNEPGPWIKRGRVARDNKK